MISIDPKRVYLQKREDCVNPNHVIVDLEESQAGPNGERLCWYQCTVKGGREARDICAVTVAKAAEALKAHGARRVYAYATHAIFSGNAANNLKESVIDEIIVTDSIPLSAEMKQIGKVKQLTLSEMLAETIRRISNEESISAMFEY